MEAPTLGSIFTKHLGFPARSGAAVATESLAERIAGRQHAFVPEKNDPEAWVEHFFELEHPLEDRQRELEALGAADKAPAVLEFSLSANEFVVIENEDEVVVVSDQGSIVLQNTAELSARLRAAQMPERVASPNQVFKGPGDRAYFVSQSGKVVALDARVVARAIEQAPAPRVEPLARVAAASRLSAFAPAARQSPAPKTTFASEQLRGIARAESKGGPAQVVVVEKGQAKQVSGDTARFWQRMTSALTAGGRRSENLGRTLPGASAVALGTQTYAVRAGGVTALVQRPVQGLGTRAEVASSKARIAEQRALSSTPRWLQRSLDERARTSGFWIAPAASAATSAASAARPDWVERALQQARSFRERAREEARGRIDPPRASYETPAIRRESVMPAGSAATMLGAVAPAGLPAIAISESRGFDFTLPEIRVHSATSSLEDAGAGYSLAEAMPASTLRALYTGIERTAAADGYRVSALDLRVEAPNRLDSAPTGSSEAFVDARFAPPVIRSIEVETERVSVAPAYFAAPFGEDGSVRVGADLTQAIAASLSKSVIAPASSVAPALPEAARTAAAMGASVTIPTVPARFTGSSAVTLPAVVATAMRSTGAPARLGALAWLDWAIENTPFAHARQTGSMIGGPSVQREFGAPAAAPPAAPPPPSQRLSVTLPRMGTAPAALSAVAVSHDGAAVNARSEQLGALAFTTGAAPDATTPSAVHDIAVPHESAHVVQQSHGVSAPAALPPLFSATGPRIGQERAREAEGMAGPKTARGTMLKPLSLVDVNAAREPRPAHAEPSSEPSAEHIEIGVPLHVQMTEARHAPAEHALATTAPASVSFVPVVTTSAVDASGTVAAPPAPPPPPGTTTLPRPTGQITAAPASASRPSLSRAHSGPASLGAASSSGAVPSHALADSAPALTTVASGPPAPSSGTTAPASGAPDLHRPGSMLPASAHRKAHGESTASSSTIHAASASGVQGSGSGLPHYDRIQASFGSHDVSHVQAYTGASASAASKSIGAAAYATGSNVALASASPSPVVAHEAAHVVQQPAGVSFAATDRVHRKTRGSGVLRFSYPSQPRWWGAGAAAPSASAEGVAATHPLAAEGAAAPALVTTRRLDLPPTAEAQGLPAHAAAMAAAPAGSTALVPARMSSPASYGARGARVNASASASASAGPRGSSAPAAYAHIGGTAPTATMELSGPREGEAAYVAVAPTGEAKVMGPRAAAELASRRRAGGAVEMTVVAGMAPQAPSLEDMATAGHERPHLKGKKEGGAKSAHGKTDALSLQGTVDSLAQRIYHRLKRRLQSDRERFGG